MLNRTNYLYLFEDVYRGWTENEGRETYMVCSAAYANDRALKKLEPFHSISFRIEYRWGQVRPQYTNVLNCGNSDLEAIQASINILRRDENGQRRNNINTQAFFKALPEHKIKNPAYHVAYTLTKKECILIVDFANKTYKPALKFKYKYCEEHMSTLTYRGMPRGTHYFYLDDSVSLTMRLFDSDQVAKSKEDNLNKFLSLWDKAPEFKDCAPEVTRINDKLYITNPLFVAKLKTAAAKPILNCFFKSAGIASVITSYMDFENPKLDTLPKRDV